MPISLNDDFELKTAHPQYYKEWSEDKKIFKSMHHIFTLAFSVGILKNKKSDKPTHGLVRYNLIRDSGTRSIIEFAYDVLCKGSTPQERWSEVLAYADGGLEELWKDYQKQGLVDLPRILGESKKEWPARIKKLASDLKK